MSVGVRRAADCDVDEASAVLADAFADYPWTRWTVESHRHRERVEGLQRLSMDRIALPYGNDASAIVGNRYAPALMTGKLRLSL